MGEGLKGGAMPGKGQGLSLGQSRQRRPGVGSAG